jgi:hypothetical protein
MALKSNIVIAAACVFAFTMGVYINSLHDMALHGPERLRGFMSRISAPSSIVLPPQQASSYNASREHGPLVRVTDSLYFITGAPVLILPLPFHGRSPLSCAGAAGSSCAKACKSAGLRCSAQGFSVLNDCKALGSAFGLISPCSLDFYGPDLPAALPGAGLLMANRFSLFAAPFCSSNTAVHISLRSLLHQPPHKSLH